RGTARGPRSTARSFCYRPRRVARARDAPLLHGRRPWSPPLVREGTIDRGRGGAQAPAARWRWSGSWVRRLVDLEQALAIHAGVDLRGRERGVAEQFLDRAQIAAARQEVSRERMPQR